MTPGTTVPVIGKGKTGAAAIGEALAAQTIKPHLIHETVTNDLARRRAGTHSTKTRSEVRGGGAKPWRQKGTGRARQGSIRAPQWEGGGIVFGPSPRSYGGKVNRKIQTQAFLAALKAHIERGSIAVLADTGWDTPSTKKAAEFLAQAPEGVAKGRPLLVVLDDLDSVEAKSLRNIPGVYLLHASELETVDIVVAQALLVDEVSWSQLSTRGSSQNSTEKEKATA